jgi:RNA polymerase sigma factor (sigma-70 family)
LGEEIENLSLFCELDDGQLECFADAYAQQAFDGLETEFQVMQYTVEVRDSLLYDALSQLDERSRNVILMWHWLEMTDQEIADEIGKKRRTVNDIRRNAHRQLKNILEADGYDASSFFSKHES